MTQERGSSGMDVEDSAARAAFSAVVRPEEGLGEQKDYDIYAYDAGVEINTEKSNVYPGDWTISLVVVPAGPLIGCRLL